MNETLSYFFAAAFVLCLIYVCPAAAVYAVRHAVRRH